MRKLKYLLLTLGVAALVVAVTPAIAGKGGGHSNPAAASCAVSGSTVAASGLPTDQVINFMVNDATGTWGWVLGFTPDGTWSVTAPSASGPTTYQFVSKTWGPNGSKYTIFASC